MKCCCFLITLSLLIAAVVVRSQQLSFKLYTSAEGLSQNSGYCMAQDGLGYLWMGTQDGLNKFNGKKITAYYKETVKRGNLINNFIRSLYYDSTTNWLWIGTDNGLCIYNIAADSFYKASYYFPQADTLDKLMIGNITAISKAAVAVATLSEGFFICNTGTHKTQQYLQQPATKNRARSIITWNNNIIGAANGRLYKLTGDTAMLMHTMQMGDVRNMLVWKNDLWVASASNGLYRITNTDNPQITLFDCGSKEVGALIVDKNNNLWIGTRDKGLVIIEPDNYKIIQSFETAINQDEWPKKFTLSLLKDRQDIIWAGSSGGGFGAAGSLIKDFNIIKKNELLAAKAPHNMILSIMGPLNDILYTGTQLEGLRTYNVKTKALLSYKLPGFSGSNTVQCITTTGPDDIWLATSAGLYNFNVTTKKTICYRDSTYPASADGQSVYKLRYRDSLLYSGGSGALFFDLKSKKFKPLNYTDSSMPKRNLVVHKAYESSGDIIWLCCRGYGLIKYSLQTKALSSIDEVMQFSKDVYAVYAEGDTLWLATSAGLLLYDSRHNKAIKKITQANGLPGNVVYSIEKSNEGDFWCSTNSGLIKVNPHNFSIVHIPASVGLQAGEFNKTCSSKDEEGNLYFGGINGISFFNPSSFSVSQYSPAPLIESIKVFNKELSLQQHIAYTNNIQLTHLQNFITFEFAVLNFINNNECNYRYRMIGVDSNWVQAGNRNFVSYTNLQPGNYLFELSASNSGGVWSRAITTIAIIIHPAWWQTIWCRLAVLLGIAFIVTAMVKKRIARIRHDAAIKQQITETEMAALKAQMNPHFMFNCINSIDAFIHSNDKYNATLYLNKFAKLLRNILDSSKHNTVIFTKDIATLKLYIELEELRHENKFSTAISIQEELLNSDYKVPPLIIQPFVENAILHGLKNKEGNNGLLQIDIKRSGDFIEYTIRDNGIGRVAAKQIIQNKESHYGMQMSFERIRLFNREKEPSVQITDLYNDSLPAGTLIKVFLNIL
jgi:ligand-binding sensor domain-containing protein